MKAFAIFTLFILITTAAERSHDGMISIKTFEISPPASGTYAPWRDRKDSAKWYAGELVKVSDSEFRYTRFSDAVDPNRPNPDYSGKLRVLKEHIYLDHPGVPYPYRISGLADGVPVLLTWEGYEQWKKAKKIFRLNILYLEKRAEEMKKNEFTA